MSNPEISENQEDRARIIMAEVARRAMWRVRGASILALILLIVPAVLRTKYDSTALWVVQIVSFILGAGLFMFAMSTRVRINQILASGELRRAAHGMLDQEDSSAKKN